jgi:hypothetical protein
MSQATCLFCGKPVEGVDTDDLSGSEMADIEAAHPECCGAWAGPIPEGTSYVIVPVMRKMAEGE